MSNSTVYDIRLQYLIEDKATKPLAKIDKGLGRVAKSSKKLQKVGRPLRILDAQLDTTARKAGGLGRTFSRMATGAAAYFGIRAGVKHLIGFNANMEQAKIQMAGMIQLTTRMDAAAASSRATDLVDTLQQKAKLSVGTTKDMVDMASMITRPVLAAGLGMKELADFTAQAVVASRAFGIESGMAARDIEAALMGQLRSVDRFSRALLEPLGFVGEKGREAFNELGAAARAAKLGEALGGDAITSMAKAQEASFSGVLSTFQDTMQMTMGAVGLPLFKEITAEIVTWNQWITKNGDKVADFGDRMGRGLVSGFRMVKSVIGFMVDHADLLLTVAKIWGAVKIGQKLGGMADALGQAAGRFTRRAGGFALGKGMDRAGLATAKFGNTITSVASGFGRLIPAIGLAAVAFQSISTWWNKEKTAKAAKIRSEKAEAKQLVAGYDPALAGVTKLKGAAGGTIQQQMEILGVMQRDRADSGGKMSLEETALAASLKEQLPTRQAFWKSTASLAQRVGIETAGDISALRGRAPEGFEGSRQDYMAGRMRRELGGGIGVGGIASGTSELALYQGLGAFTDQLATSTDVQGDIAKMIMGAYTDPIMVQALRDLAMSGNLNGSVAKKPDFRVTIQRIEVQSDDPSRFVVGLTETVRDAVRNRSAAYDTLVEGS